MICVFASSFRKKLKTRYILFTDAIEDFRSSQRVYKVVFDFAPEVITQLVVAQLAQALIHVLNMFRNGQVSAPLPAQVVARLFGRCRCWM